MRNHNAVGAGRSLFRFPLRLAGFVSLTLQVVTIGPTTEAIAQSGTGPLPPLEVQTAKPKAKAPAKKQKAQTALPAPSPRFADHVL